MDEPSIQTREVALACEISARLAEWVDLTSSTARPSRWLRIAAAATQEPHAFRSFLAVGSGGIVQAASLALQGRRRGVSKQALHKRHAASMARFMGAVGPEVASIVDQAEPQAKPGSKAGIFRGKIVNGSSPEGVKRG